MIPAPERLVVGRVRRAHGMRGELVIEPITDAPDEVYFPGKRLFVGAVEGNSAADVATLLVQTVRPFQEGLLLVKFESIAGRSEAESWRGRYLLSPLSELRPLDENEVYLHDLVGMTVELESGEVVGSVRAVINLPQGPALDVSHGTKALMLPFHPEFVRTLDGAGRRVVMRLPEGMLE